MAAAERTLWQSFLSLTLPPLKPHDEIYPANLSHRKKATQLSGFSQE